jgi:hypothetical protein
MSCETLISTADLQSRLADPALFVIDCRHDFAKPAWRGANLAEIGSGCGSPTRARTVDRQINSC